MTWTEIKELFEEFGWEVTSDFAIEYQENPWTHRLLDALLATVDDRNEVESTIAALAEDREEARIEVAVLQDEADDADELTVGERRNYRRLQELVDDLAGCPVTTVANGSMKALVVTPDQLSELTRLATFPLPKPKSPFATGGVIPATRIWSGPIDPVDPPEIYIDGKRVEVRRPTPRPPGVR